MLRSPLKEMSPQKSLYIPKYTYFMNGPPEYHIAQENFGTRPKYVLCTSINIPNENSRVYIYSFISSFKWNY